MATKDKDDNKGRTLRIKLYLPAVTHMLFTFGITETIRSSCFGRERLPKIYMYTYIYIKSAQRCLNLLKMAKKLHLCLPKELIYV